ncbi:MAG TPA: hypothetical protein VJ872_02470 [Nocardioides sp.]|nr:hypothetical protein [Nocardioides sp.]
MGSEDVLVRPWRPSILTLITLWSLTTFFATCSAAVVVIPGPWYGRAPVAALFLTIATLTALESASRIDLYDDRLVMRRIRRRVRVVPLETVRAVSPDRYGLTIQTGRYTAVTGPRLIGYKAPLTHLLGISNRGDRIAAVIVARAEAHRALHPDTRPEVERVADDLVATLGVAGHCGEAAWLEGRVSALSSPDETTRLSARRELHEVSAGGLGEIYLGTNRAFFDERLSRLAALTAAHDDSPLAPSDGG